MITINETKITSTYLTEEYFPIKIQFSNYSLESIKNYARFDYDDSNALELSFNKNKPYDIVEITLLAANRFNVIDESYSINQTITDGSVISKVPEKTHVNEFIINIYKNVTEIKLCNEAIDNSLKCGNVIFNFTSSMVLASIILDKINDDVRKHIITELEYTV